MGELPARLPDDLPQPVGHAVEEWPEVQGAAQGLSRRQVFWLGRPAAPQEEVEGQGRGKDVIIVELGRGNHPLAPARGSEGVPVQPSEEEQPRLRLPQPGEQRRQRGLAPSRWTFQQEALSLPDVQTTPLQNGGTAGAVTK